MSFYKKIVKHKNGKFLWSAYLLIYFGIIDVEGLY